MVRWRNIRNRSQAAANRILEEQYEDTQYKRRIVCRYRLESAWGLYTERWLEDDECDLKSWIYRPESAWSMLVRECRKNQNGWLMPLWIIEEFGLDEEMSELNDSQLLIIFDATAITLHMWYLVDECFGKYSDWETIGMSSLPKDKYLQYRLLIMIISLR